MDEIFNENNEMSTRDFYEKFDEKKDEADLRPDPPSWRDLYTNVSKNYDADDGDGDHGSDADADDDDDHDNYEHGGGPVTQLSHNHQHHQHHKKKLFLFTIYS